MSVISEEERVPELGDRITILSKTYGSITGRIVFRDEAMIRVKPQGRRVYDFPTNPDSGEFDPTLGVEQIQFHAKRSSPWFSKQLAVLPDSDILLYTIDPTPEKVHVVNVISTEEEDALIIRREGKEDVERIDFDFRGPPIPILYIEPTIVETEPEPFLPEPESDSLPELEAPGAVMEIANIDKIYSDQVQLEEIVTSLLSEYPVERHSSERLITILRRQASTFLSLKQMARQRSYTATTVLDAIQSSKEPLEAILPITTIRRSLYLEDTAQETELYEVHNVIESFRRMIAAESSGFDTASDSRGNRFAKYISAILNTGSGITEGTLSTPYLPTRVVVDQEVFRAPPGLHTRGLVRDLPAGRHIYGSSFKGDIKIKQRYIGNISHQTYRLIGELVMKHPDTGQIIQLTKANVLEPVEYLLLPPSIAQQHCTVTRTGVLLWDVQRSEQVRSQTCFSSNVETSTDVHTIDDSLTLADALADRVTSPVYNIADPLFRSILDEIGLRDLEWTPELIDTVSHLLTSYQSNWMQTYEEVKKYAMEPIVNVPILSSAVDASSSLLTSIESVPLLQDISKEVKARETSLKELDFVVAESLLTETRRTRIPLWYASAAGRPEELKEIIDQESRIVASELYRISVLEARSAEIESSYHAEPIINSCEHVKELELLRDVENDSDRMKLLDLFYKKYEGGIKENWIQCNICHQDLLCRHEILLLQEFKNAMNTKILHKTLLIEFGDRQYDDRYICKNCGIILGNIEFDTTPEFDSEGNLTQGRSIITEDTTVTLENLDLATAIQETELKESKMTEDKLKIYHVVNVLFEYAGANPSDAMYRQCINTIYQQLLIMENSYKERIAVKLKGRHTDNSVIIATLLTILSTAYVIAELQISESALPIYIAKQGCTFSRDGIPRDKEGTGLLDYIVCILLEIDINRYPWTELLWQSLNGEARRKLVIQEVKYALNELSKIPTITDALHAAKNKMEKDSNLQKTIPLYRPRMSAPPAITNREAFQQSVFTSPLPSILQEVIGRSEALSQEIVQTAHQHAFQTKEDLPKQSKRLDGQCGRVKLQDIGQSGFGIVGLQSEGTQNEIQLLREAMPHLLQRDPTHSLGMSHFITPWSVHPITKKDEQTQENIESLSFRLFLKACATGPTAGLPHEYGVDRICRRCGVRFPIEVLDLTVEEEYFLQKEAVENSGKKLEELRESLQQIITKKDTISKQVLEEADVKTDYDAFLILQDRIHMRKKVEPIEPSVSPSWIDQMTDILQDIPSLYANWTLFTTFFKGITPSTSEKDRIAQFIPVSNLIPEYLRKITNQYITLIGKAREKEAEKTITAFATHLQTIDSVRSLITLFVNPLTRIANGIESSIKGSKWFQSITFEHEFLLQTIWKEQYKLVDTALEHLDNIEDENYKTAVYNALQRYTTLVGSLLEVIFHFIRVSPSIRAVEYRDLIHWILLGSISLLLDESSLFYDVDATSPILRQMVASFLGTTIFPLFTSMDTQRKLYNKTPEEIRFKIEARKQQERQRFVLKQDKLSSDAEKRADNLMKLFGIGDYSEGALKRKFAYDAEYYEFHRNQRLEYGLPDFSQDISNVEETNTTSAIEEAGTFDEYIGQNEQE